MNLSIPYILYNESSNKHDQIYSYNLNRNSGCELISWNYQSIKL